MTRIEVTYEITCLKFGGFNTETNEPILEDCTYELTNVRIPKDSDPIEAITNALARKIGTREAGKISVKSYTVKSAIKYELSDEEFKAHATATDITESYIKEDN